MASEQDIDDLTKQILSLGVDDAKVNENQEKLEAIADLIKKGKAKNIMVLSGAGVSVAAGIPDFRTPGTGLYDNLAKYNLPYPQAVFDVSFYKKKPQPFCTLAKELWPGLTHSPTLTHSFLKLLSDKGLLLRNYSQNIDGLEFLAGLPDEELVECHGHFRTASCIDCGFAADGEKVKNIIVTDASVPKCRKCNGNVKPDIVFFGESLPNRFHRLIKKDIKKADLLLIMGTSLQVAPVSEIPSWVKCNRVLFNRESVLNLKKGDSFIPGDCDTNVQKLCEILDWEQDLLEHNKKVILKNKATETPDDKDS